MEKSRILTMSGTAHPPDTGFYQCSCFRENQLPQTMSGTAHPPDTGFYQCSCFRENQLPLAGKGTRKTIRKDCRSISSYKAHGQSDEGTGRGLVITHKGR
jgi:hypothetical protein